MLRWMRRQRSAEGGNAAVEFALVLPLLLALLLGVIEFGRVLFLKQVITNAAREAARASVTGYESYTSAANKVLAPAGIEGAKIKVKQIKVGSPAVSTAYEVKISYTAAYITPIGPVLALLGSGSSLGKDIKLSSTAVMRQ